MIDIHEDTIIRYLEGLRPKDEEMRARIDYDYLYKNQIVILYQVRPDMNARLEKLKLPFAKIRYYKTRRTWNLYWMRASGKWHAYEPNEYTTLKQVIAVIDDDSYGCFFG